MRSSRVVPLFRCRRSVPLVFWALLALAFVPLTPVVSSAHECLIQGPDRVAAGASFTLCGPDGGDLHYTWEGKGLPTKHGERCVTIEGLSPGTYEYKLCVRFSRNETRTCLHEVTVGKPAGACAIEGPSSARSGEEVELCGPQGDHYTYEWSGAGLTSTKSDRCINVRFSTAGTYTLTLKVWQRGTFLSSCTHELTVGSGGGTKDTCMIEGPDTVGLQREFTLCGPEGKGLTYAWTGSGTVLDASERCARITLYATGTFTYWLTVWQNGTPTYCSHTVIVGDVGGKDSCSITGPANVAANQPFTLCGPEGDQWSYTWMGPNLPVDNTSRCVRILGLTPGTHWYSLTLENGLVSKCTWSVTVGDSGKPGAVCPQPASFWTDRCASGGKRWKGDWDGHGHGGGDGDDDDDRDRGGKGGNWNEEFARIAACVDERTSLFDWSEDARSFCRLLSGKDKHAQDQLLKQYAVLLANLCAAELGIRGRDGGLIGLDPTSAVSCRDLTGTTVGDVADHVASLLENPDQHSRKDLLRAASCLSKLNRGRGMACEKDEDDDAHQIAMAEAELEVTDGAATADLGLPVPNPFKESMRMRFAVQSPAEVRIGVYDLAGRMIQSLASGHWSAGTHEVSWNGIASDGSRARAGMYFVRGTVGAQRVGARVMYVR